VLLNNLPLKRKFVFTAVPLSALDLDEGATMGLLDFLINLFTGGSKVQCPSCGVRGARKSADGIIHCPNASCPYFDSRLGARSTLQRGGTTVPTRGDFRPTRPISIRYRNFQGQERTFTADADATVRKRNHLVARVTPTGRKIVLSRDRIQNLSEVDNALPQRVDLGQPWPNPRERQVLSYHKKHGTSSPLYERIRAKYPNWLPE
jgi:hypothetical protein